MGKYERQRAKWHNYRRKKDELYRLELDHVPVRLTDRDINGENSPQTTERKFRKFKAWLKEREEFEREWRHNYEQ